MTLRRAIIRVDEVEEARYKPERKSAYLIDRISAWKRLGYRAMALELVVGFRIT